MSRKLQAMSDNRNLNRRNSWPLSKLLQRAFRNEVAGYAYNATPLLPSFLHMQRAPDESSSDSEMPAALCGWCDAAIDCGIHLSYCITWQRVSAQLHIDTPRAYRRAHAAQPASEMSAEGAIQ